MEIHYADHPMFEDFTNFLKFSDMVPRRDLPICLNKFLDDKECILFNVEELTRTDTVISIPPNVVEVWDFSLVNIKILNDNGVTNTRHVPFTLWEEHRKKIESYNVEMTYDYDVVFVGWISARRNKILEELSLAGINVVVLSSLFGEDRDRIIAKSKILLNIHYGEDYKIFELYRCFPWLETGKTIVTENSLDNDSRCINVDYDDLVNTVLRVLEK